MHAFRSRYGLFILATTIGALGWIGLYASLVLVIFFPWLWTKTNTRANALACSIGYYLAASQGVILGCSRFFSIGLWGGFAMWLGVGVIHASLWVLLWNKNERTRRIVLPLILVLAAIPPFGVLGWAHPITAAGVLFPGLRLFGLLGCFFLIVGLPWLLESRYRGYWLGLVALIAVVANLLYRPATITGWHGFDTHNRNDAAKPDFVEQFRQQMILIDLTKKTQGVSVFPEISSGDWTSTTADLWSQELNGTDNLALVGTTTDFFSGHEYDNVMVAVGKGRSIVVYRQRMPSPVSMWRPWTDTGCRAHWFSNPVFQFEGKRVAGLICNEQYLVWPVVHSLLMNPDVIVATGNVWSVEGTTLPALQRSILRAWSSLWRKPLVQSFNQ